MMRAVTLLAFMLPPLAAAEPATCPQFLPQGTIEVSHPPAGWMGSSPSPARLNAAGMMSGHPKLMNYLKPASVTRPRGGGSIATWRFDPGEEKWLICTYGTSAVQLSKRLDDAGTICTVTSKVDRVGSIVEMTAICTR